LIEPAAGGLRAAALRAVRLTRLDLAGQAAHGVDLIEAALDDVDLTGAKLGSASLRDAAIADGS